MSLFVELETLLLEVLDISIKFIKKKICLLNFIYYRKINYIKKQYNKHRFQQFLVIDCGIEEVVFLICHGY